MSAEQPMEQPARQPRDVQRQMERLRAIYAVVAGVLLLAGVPLYQSAILGPGYAASVAPAVAHADFAPLLAWIAGHSGADRGARIVQLLPFLLALPLPGFLYGRLWPAPPASLAPAPSPVNAASSKSSVAPAAAPSPSSQDERERRLGTVALWAGRAGFALFALAILLGLLTSAAAASAYASATTAAGRSAALASFAQTYVVQTLLSQVLGGLALAIFLALVTRRWHSAPTYFRLYGYLVAAVLTLNALAFLLSPAQVQTPFTTGALLGLGLWLLGLGLFLPGIGVEPAAESASEGR